MYRGGQANDSVVLGTITCPAGKVVLSGGATKLTLSSGRAEILDSAPYQPSSDADMGWRVALGKQDGSAFVGGDVLGYTMFAICATAG